MKNLYLLLLFCSSLMMAAPPNIVPPSPLVQCDANNDGTEVFDVTSKNSEILQLLTASEYSVAYYADNAHTVPFLNPFNMVGMTNIVVYIQVTEIANPTNFASTLLELVMAPLPDAVNVPDLIVAENPMNGTAVFNLASQTPAIVNTQSNITVTYYLTQAGAAAGVGPIIPATAYSNTSNPQTIWVRSANNVTGCYSIMNFDLSVVSDDIVNIPDDGFKDSLILEGLDTNTDNEIQVSEALAATELDIEGGGFSDVTGIEAFQNAQRIYMRGIVGLTSVSINNLPNLKVLNFDNSDLISASFSNLPVIDTLSMKFNQLSGLLNLSTLPNLKSIDISGNNVSSLDISTLTQLKKFYYSNNEVPMAMLLLPPVNVIEDINCLGNALTTLDLSLFPSLKRLDCRANNFGVFTVPALAHLEYLECGGNELTSLVLSPSLPALKEIICQTGHIQTINLSPYTTLERIDFSYNELTSFNIDGLINLKFLDVSSNSNHIPSFNLTPLTALEQVTIWGNWHTTLDVSNLTNLTDLYCGGTLMTSMNLANTPALKKLNCGGAALTELDLTGHNNLEELSCNGNPLGTIDLSGAPNLKNINCWSTGLTSLDVSMLPHLMNITCSGNAITTLDFSNNPELIYVSAADADLLSVFLKNGSQQYFNDDWFDFPTLEYICVDEGIEEEWFRFNALPGTSVNTYCSFPPGGDYNTITGTIRLDSNNDGCDASDVTPQFIKLNVTGPTESGVVYTNASGQYTIFTDAGETSVEVSLENSAYFDLVLPFGHNFLALDGSVFNQDICLSPNGTIPDLEVIIAPIAPARPGFNAVYKIVYKNKGNQLINNGSVQFVYDDDKLSFISADVSPDVNDTGLLTWNYGDLMPFESRSFEVTLNVNAPTHPTNPVNVNDILMFNATVNPTIGDETLVDNLFTFMQTVIGSYDPNDMYCIEGNVVSTDEIGKYLHYVINFENTGTDIAENIVVTDEILPEHYDINSLRIINSSDDVNVSINGNKATFFFRDIKLPIGGHGNILLKIKSNGALTQGDSVLNKADIFFDYNLPITTNDAETLFQQLSNPGHPIDNSVSVYPNPTRGIVNIKASTDIKSVQLYDGQGRLLQTSLRSGTDVNLDISAHQTGIYFLKISSDKGTKIQKIIKE